MSEPLGRDRTPAGGERWAAGSKRTGRRLGPSTDGPHPGPRDRGGQATFLEPDQLVAGTRRPVPPAVLGRRVRAALWALRVFVVLLAVMVIYVFVAQVR